MVKDSTGRGDPARVVKREEALVMHIVSGAVGLAAVTLACALTLIAGLVADIIPPIISGTLGWLVIGGVLMAILRSEP